MLSLLISRYEFWKEYGELDPIPRLHTADDELGTVVRTTHHFIQSRQNLAQRLLSGTLWQIQDPWMPLAQT
jgi:hypothetical protein